MSVCRIEKLGVEHLLPGNQHLALVQFHEVGSDRLGLVECDEYFIFF